MKNTTLTPAQIDYLESWDKLPKTVQLSFARASRQDRYIMGKLKGTLIQETQLILDKKSTLCASDRQYILATVAHAIRTVEAEKTTSLETHFRYLEFK